MVITAPKFEAVFNNNGKFFRLLQDSFHPTEYVDGLIAEIYEREGFVTYIIDDALVHYMKTSFKRLKEGRRDKFPNYEIIGLSESGFTPYAIPEPKVGTVENYKAIVEGSQIICGSTQLKRKMVISTMMDFKRKYKTGDLLFFVSYSDDMLADFAAGNNLPMALMAADMPGPMPSYFGAWYDWYYLRCSRQDKANMALVNSRTCDLALSSARPAGVGDHSFFKRDTKVEDWIAENTSLSCHQAKNANVRPNFSANVECHVGGPDWVAVPQVDLNWGGLGRGRDDSFGLCESEVDYGPTVTLRIETEVKGVYFCGFFMRLANRNGKILYTPLPVKNQVTLTAINERNGMRLS